MAKTNITEFSNVASNNTDINSVNIDENCPASNLNNALRELMKALKDVDTGSQALTALTVTGVGSFGSLDISGDIDVDGTTNLDVVDIDGAVDMASTLTVGGDLTVTSSANSTLNITAGGTSNDSLINFVHGSTTDGGITYDHNGAYASEQMKFRTGNNTANMTLTGAGALTVANGLTLTDGNLVVANGHGIDFSATGNISGTSQELLDDYEEGSFDVAMADGTSHSLTQNASYTKIGRMVHFQAKVIFPNTGTDTTVTRLSLPFTVSSRTNYFASSVVSSNGSANAQIVVGIGNSATLLLQNIDGSTQATNQHLTSANLNISLHYETT